MWRCEVMRITSDEDIYRHCKLSHKEYSVHNAEMYSSVADRGREEVIWRCPFSRKHLFAIYTGFSHPPDGFFPEPHIFIEAIIVTHGVTRNVNSYKHLYRVTPITATYVSMILLRSLFPEIKCHHRRLFNGLVRPFTRVCQIPLMSPVSLATR